MATCTCVAVQYLRKQERYVVQVEEAGGEKVKIPPVNLQRRERTPQFWDEEFVGPSAEENSSTIVEGKM